jgi:hypothetical protein
MEGVANNIVDKLSPEFIQACVAGAAAVYLFLCVRGRTISPIRRDKKGALYLYSHRYSLDKDRMKKISECVERNAKDINDIKMTSKRTELLLYINTNPTKIEVIEKMAKEYEDQGGNSYVTNDVIPIWREKYAKKITEGRI